MSLKHDKPKRKAFKSAASSGVCEEAAARGTAQALSTPKPGGWADLSVTFIPTGCQSKRTKNSPLVLRRGQFPEVPTSKSTPLESRGGQA